MTETDGTGQANWGVPSARYLRVAAALVAAALVTTACATASTAGSGPGQGSSSGSPALTSVASGRYVAPIDLDDGDLMVDPPGAARAHVPRSVAEAMFRASSVVDGTYRFSIIGLGVATLAPTVASVGSPTSSTPSVAPPSNTAGAAATGGTSAVTATSLSGVAPPTGAAATYNDRLAWVGIAWGSVQSCPSAPANSSTATTHATRYEAVLFDAQTGGSALAFTSGGVAPCGGRTEPATVSQPVELVSVPWQAVSPRSTAVSATIPPCAQYFGWTQVAAVGAGTVQVVASAPFGAECGTTTSSTRVVDDVIPLGSAQAQVGHAALGPVAAMHSLTAS